MNQQWMTTLLSDIQTKLRKSLEDRGIRISSADLAAVIEEISPQASKSLLSVAMDFIRPFNLGMGFRISKLTDTNLEIVIPGRARNKGSGNHLHEAVLVAASIEAIQSIWERHQPVGSLAVGVQSFEFRQFKECMGEARLRLELPENVREAAMSSIRQFSVAELDHTCLIFDDQEHATTELRFKVKLKYQPALTQSGEK